MSFKRVLQKNMINECGCALFLYQGMLIYHYWSYSNVIACFFTNETLMNLELWRCNVECADLIFCARFGATQQHAQSPVLK